MIGRIRLGIGLGVLIAASAGASSASAQMGFGPGGYGLGYFNYGYNQPRIPYYALYPPVYYSYPVARPYGFSPFAYPPGAMTPDAAPTSAAVEYRNPYVPSKAKPAKNDDRTAALGRMYINPYVAAGQRAGGPALAKQEPR
jgi:hypothetical protein